MGMLTRPNTLDTFTMCPSPAARRWGRKALVPWTTPQKLMSINQWASSSDMASTVAPRATPALLTTRWTAPNSSMTASAQACT